MDNKTFFETLMAFEEKEHWKIICELKEIKQSVEDLKAFRWMSIGGFSVISLLMGGVGSVVISHWLRG
jgi:hypothetical protein